MFAVIQQLLFIGTLGLAPLCACSPITSNTIASRVNLIRHSDLESNLVRRNKYGVEQISESTVCGPHQIVGSVTHYYHRVSGPAVSTLETREI